ncbi:MAG: histidinol dehydrogenase [Firmicutes bacterium HGW-Firmicutes-20]|jgi:histidinol dehydrogenase|nr:MAG: histidinol dehydrogenase [Firmicutes bacterium HGW-Firmicutes-20]PKM89850.1 MAG: histidinol dehydrogenase [Firmicutes bacterium HGW-Firmicutes-10]
MKIIEVFDTNVKKVLDRLIKRGDEDFLDVDSRVTEILKNVKSHKDEALFEYTKQFDGAALTELRVTEKEIEEAMGLVDDELIEIMKEAATNIREYHQLQKEKTWLQTKENGIILGQLITPIQRVGIYVPGGKAVYPSTLLMNVIPAQIAQVESIAIVTPPNKDGTVNPLILAAARIVGITEIYKVGGAQAIGALAYGTQTIDSASKIVGPGNIYVARAKRSVYGLVDIDMIAGPSEICVVADQYANPKFVAADLLSQAEHDEMASAILVTHDRELALNVIREVESQSENSVRRDIIEESLSGYGYIFLTKDIESSIALANELAPEHLELMVKDPFSYLSQIKNAGAIFLGDYTPEPIGDYFAGPNHTLPTSSSAKFSSPLGVYDFMKKSSIVYYPKSALDEVADKVIKFAVSEGLDAHANALRVRK